LSGGGGGCGGGGERGFKCYEGETERTNFERLLSSLNEISLKKEVYMIGDWNIDLENPNARFFDELNDWCDLKGMIITNNGITTFLQLRFFNVSSYA